jgi:glycosyltransferase involved in cell wall biosynthesis
LVEELTQRRDGIRYTIFVRRGNASAFEGLPTGVDIVVIPEALAANMALRLAAEHLLIPFVARILGVRLLHYTGSVAPLLKLGRVVFTSHWVPAPILLQSFSAPKRLYFRFLHGPAIRRADGVIAVSSACRDELVEVLAVKAKRIAVIHHGVGEQFRRTWSESERIHLLSAHGIRAPYVISVTTDNAYKDLPTLLQAFRKLKEEQRIPHQLVLVGRIKTERIKALSNGEFRSGEVVCTGYVDHGQIAGLIAGADLLVYASWRETFGLPLVEAMAANVPVVASDLPALAEVAGSAALLVPPGDVDALAKAMSDVLGDSARANRLRKLGSARAGQFSWAKAAELTASFYRDIL